MRRLLLLGAGAIARHHAAAALGSALAPVSELHVADPSEAALGSFAAQFPTAVGHRSAMDLLALPARPGDLVVVATPPYAHRELVLAAVATGRPVLCEKPLAMTADEAWEMARAAAGRGVPLAGCDVRFLGLPTTERAKQLLRHGKLGVPYHVSFVNRRRRARPGVEYQPASSWFRDPRLSGGGVLMDWGPYDVAVLNDVLDPVRFEVASAWQATPRTAGLDQAEAARSEQHVGAQLRLHLAGGETVAVSYERAACTHGAERSTVEIEGSDGAVEWDWLDWVGSNRVRYTADRDGEPVSTVDTLAPTDGGHHARPYERLHQRASTAETLFNFLCLRAIHDAAVTGSAQAVERVAL